MALENSEHLDEDDVRRIKRDCLEKAMNDCVNGYRSSPYVDELEQLQYFYERGRSDERNE